MLILWQNMREYVDKYFISLGKADCELLPSKTARSFVDLLELITEMIAPCDRETCN